MDTYFYQPTNFTRLKIYSYLHWTDLLTKISKLSTKERLLLPHSHLLGPPQISLTVDKPIDQKDLNSIHYLVQLSFNFELTIRRTVEGSSKQMSVLSRLLAMIRPISNLTVTPPPLIKEDGVASLLRQSFHLRN